MVIKRNYHSILKPGYVFISAEIQYVQEVVSYYIKWVTTSWVYSRKDNGGFQMRRLLI